MRQYNPTAKTCAIKESVNKGGTEKGMKIDFWWQWCHAVRQVFPVYRAVSIMTT